MTAKTLSHAEHFRWMQAVLADPAFTHAQKAILVRLALHLNIKSGRCDPSLETVANGVGVEVRAVRGAIAQAHTLGWLIRHEGGGRGNTNSYGFLLKEADSLTETRHSGAEFAETRHSETRFDGARNEAPPRHKPGMAVPPNTENKKNSEYDADFERWYSIYPKRRARAKAKEAFQRIVKAGRATVEQLIGGAERYAAERAGQEWRYTKYPATWLNGECWFDDPPPRVDHSPIQSELGPKVAVGGRRRDPFL